MAIEKVLGELGLSSGEIKVYLVLLKIGPVPVSKIKESTDLHRTTIYDFLEELLNKGLASYTVQNNTKKYNAMPPAKLLEFLKEKENNVKQILPQLEKLSSFEKDEVEVEIYKGKEGLKSMMQLCLRKGKEVTGFGVDEELYKKHLPIFTEQYQRIANEKKMSERIITKMGSSYLFEHSTMKYKFFPSSSFSPTSTIMFDDYTSIVLWEPSLTTLVIKNKQLTEAYKKHFEILWKQDSMILRGRDEVRSFFDMVMDEAHQKEEWLVFGSPPIDEYWINYFDPLMTECDKRKIKTRIIYDEESKGMIDISRKKKMLKYKTLPKEFMSPAEVNIYGDIVAIVLWEDTQAIVMRNKKIAYSFKKYFEVMWKMAK